MIISDKENKRAIKKTKEASNAANPNLDASCIKNDENYEKNIGNSIVLIYCNNNSVVDPEYIQKNIELCYSYDKLLKTVNSSEDRELTESEKLHLKDTFVKNGDVLQ